MTEAIFSPPRRGELLALFGFFLAVTLVANQAYLQGYVALFGDGFMRAFRTPLGDARGWSAFLHIVRSNVAEEFIRTLPFTLGALALDRRGRALGRRAALVMAVLTAVAFGAAHVGNGLPLGLVIGVQGFTGLLLNALFLKASGIADGFRAERALGALAYTTVAHVTFNLLPFVLLMSA